MTLWSVEVSHLRMPGRPVFLVGVRLVAVVPVRRVRREVELCLDGFDDVSHPSGSPPVFPVLPELPE